MTDSSSSPLLATSSSAIVECMDVPVAASKTHSTNHSFDCDSLPISSDSVNTQSVSSTASPTPYTRASLIARPSTSTSVPGHSTSSSISSNVNLNVSSNRLIPYCHQAGGHGIGSLAEGLLHCPPYVLKPVYNSDRGRRERGFFLFINEIRKRINSDKEKSNGVHSNGLDTNGTSEHPKKNTKTTGISNLFEETEEAKDQIVEWNDDAGDVGDAFDVIDDCDDELLDLMMEQLQRQNVDDRTYLTDVSTLLHLVPFFHELVTIPCTRFLSSTSGSGSFSPSSPSVREYLLLTDLMRHFVRPCVLDLKMGVDLSLPAESPTRKNRRNAKYPHQKQLGFRITGMRIWNHTLKEYLVFDKKYGRALKPNDIFNALNLFFSNDYSPPASLAGSERKFSAALFFQHILCHRLEQLRLWFQRQRTFRFHATSLLIAYDAEWTRNEKLSDRWTAIQKDRKLRTETNALAELSATEPNSEEVWQYLNLHNDAPKFIMKMIDFAHVQVNANEILRGNVHGEEELKHFDITSIFRQEDSTTPAISSSSSSTPSQSASTSSVAIWDDGFHYGLTQLISILKARNFPVDCTVEMSKTISDKIQANMLASNKTPRLSSKFSADFSKDGLIPRRSSEKHMSHDIQQFARNPEHEHENDSNGQAPSISASTTTSASTAATTAVVNLH